MDKDFVICTNGDRSGEWIEVYCATSEVNHRFTDIEQVLNFLRHVKVLAYSTKKFGDKVLLLPDLNAKDGYYISFIKPDDDEKG